MRAIPSPVASTMPVSRTSTRSSKSLICCLRMSLISAARISIESLSSTSGAAAAPPCYDSSRQRATQALQAGAHAAVVHSPLQRDDDSAEQLGVDLRFREHALA